MVGNHDAAIRDLMRVHLGDRLLQQVEAALALDGWTHHASDLYLLAKAGRYQMFQTANAACWTSVIEYPRTRALAVILAAGDIAELLRDIHPQVDAFADREGLERIECSGREGWARACRRLGYQTHRRAYTWAMRPKKENRETAA